MLDALNARPVNSSVMPLPMYFDVYINEKRLGTFGHKDVENMNVTVGGDAKAIFVFAGAVCREGDGLVHYSWNQVEIGPNSDVRIITGRDGPATEPNKRFEMGRTERKAWEGNVCEFCQRNETQVRRLIPGDDNRPGICSDCVDLCNRILEDEA